MSNLRITGATRLVGVIGWPVGHTRSPRMHNAALAALGLDWTYVPLPVAPERLSEAVRGLAALGFVGANVTVPHKQTVIPFIDQLTPAAAAVNSVNTLIVRGDGSLLGETTDGRGFIADLQERGLAPRRALVIGAGGAARGLVYALAEAGIETMVAARSIGRAQELCKQLAGQGLPAQPTAHRFPDELGGLAPQADLVVNATSLGMHDDDPLPWDPAVVFHPGQTVYDLIYHRRTSFMELAESHGARAIDGLGMLVHQGALAFELWTGVAAPIDVMWAAVQEA